MISKVDGRVLLREYACRICWDMYVCLAWMVGAKSWTFVKEGHLRRCASEQFAIDRS
jgi:hypothetical protein